MNWLTTTALLLFSFVVLVPANSNAQDVKFKPLVDSPTPYTIEKVRKYWIDTLPKLLPPSQMQANYAYEMPHYRKNLASRNLLIERIREGEFDHQAECEMLKHNIRLAERTRNRREAGKLRIQLAAHERGHSETSQDVEELRDLVIRQSSTIEELRAEIALLKGRRN